MWIWGYTTSPLHPKKQSSNSNPLMFSVSCFSCTMTRCNNSIKHYKTIYPHISTKLIGLVSSDIYQPKTLRFLPGNPGNPSRALSVDRCLTGTLWMGWKPAVARMFGTQASLASLGGLGWLGAFRTKIRGFFTGKSELCSWGNIYKNQIWIQFFFHWLMMMVCEFCFAWANIWIEPANSVGFTMFWSSKVRFSTG